MKSRRMVMALVVALAISGACTLLIGRRLEKKPAPPTPQVTYVVAAKPIAAGEVIRAASLEAVAWPKNLPLKGGFQNAASVTGRAALYPVAPGEPLLTTDLAAPGSGFGIATRIPQGMRAVALRTNDVVAVGGFIYPGSRVDVLVTYRATRASIPVTATVLENAQVLATGQHTEPDPKGKPTSVDIVTLLLTPEQSELAVLASEKGAIHFVLRNGGDHKQVIARPVDLHELARLPQFGLGPDTTGPRRRRAAKPKPAPYTVETILGNHTETTSF